MIKSYLTGVSLGGLNFIISILQGIILVPFILNHWQSENYGIWLSTLAFITIMRTIDTGHQTFVSNEFIKEFFIDKLKAKVILGSSIRTALLLSFIPILIYTILVFSESLHFLLGFKPDDGIKLGILAMLIMWFLVGAIGGIIVKIILPIGLFNRTAAWGLLNKLSEIIVIISSLIFGLSISMTLILMAIIQLIYSFMVLVDIKKKLPEFYPWWKYGSLQEGKSNLFKSQILTLNGFIDQFSVNGVILLVGSFLSALFVPLFTTLRTASNVFLQGNQIFINPLLPKLVQFHQENKKDKILIVLYQNWFIINLIILFPIIVITPFLRNLYTLWTNGQLEYNQTLALGLMCSVIFVSFGKIIFSYFSSINDLKVISLLNIARVFLLLPIVLFILFFFKDIDYLGFGIAFSELFASLILPVFFFKKLFNKYIDLTTLSWFAAPIIISTSYLISYPILESSFSFEYFAIIGLILVISSIVGQYYFLKKYKNINIFSHFLNFKSK